MMRLHRYRHQRGRCRLSCSAGPGKSHGKLEAVTIKVFFQQAHPCGVNVKDPTHRSVCLIGFNLPSGRAELLNAVERILAPTWGTVRIMATQPWKSGIADLVIEEIRRRKHLGIQTYGVPLQTNNGRQALRDALEEAADLTCYLMQALEEQEGR